MLTMLTEDMRAIFPRTGVSCVATLREGGSPSRSPRATGHALRRRAPGAHEHFNPAAGGAGVPGETTGRRAAAPVGGQPPGRLGASAHIGQIANINQINGLGILFLENQDSPGTLANLCRDRRVGINTVDSSARRGYRFRGRARIVPQAVAIRSPARGWGNAGAGEPVVTCVERCTEAAGPTPDELK